MQDGERRKELGQALGRVPSGLFVLTARRGDLETGMLTSWVQQVSFEPLQVSVALKQGREINAWLTPGARFTLNVLDDSQTDMVGHFGRGFALGEPAFVDVPVERPGGIAPVLSEAHAYLDCEVVARHPAGDHELVVARVVGGKVLNPGEPMVHVRKNGTHY